MKNKKLMFVCLLLIFALCITCMAACNDGEQGGFRVTVSDYDQACGTVTVSAPAEGELYAEGETVTVTVVPASGYEVSEFAVSGMEAQLDENGSFSFKISADVTIAVAFEAKKVPMVTLATGTLGEGATVSFDPQPVDGKVEKGASITMTVAVEGEYALKSVKLNGSPVELKDGKYTFVINEDSVVDVETELDPVKHILNALKGAVKFEGDLVETDAFADPEIGTMMFNSAVTTVFDPQRNAVWIKEVLDDGELITDSVISKDEEGGAVRVVHDYTDGKVFNVALYGSDDERLSYDSFANACEALTEDDLTSQDGAVWNFRSNRIANAVAASITGYDFEVATFDITIAEGKVTLSIVARGQLMEYEGNDVTIGLAFTLSPTHEDAVIPAERFEDYVADKEFSDALQNAALAKSYVATYTQNDGEDESSYVAYRVDDAVWIADPADPYGFVLRPDGKVWEFFVAEDEEGPYMWFGDDPVANSLADVSAGFDIAGISPSMFVLNEDGEYVLRENDVLYYANRGYSLAAMAATSFAFGYGEQYDNAGYATSFAIVLEGGAISAVKYHSEIEYEYYDEVITESYDCEVAFEKFGAAQFPEGVELDDALVSGTIDPDYVGVWVNEDKSVRVEITLDSIYVNVKSYDITAIIHNEDGGYTLSYEDGDVTLLRRNDKLAVSGIGENELQLRRMLCEWEDILGTFSTVMPSVSGVPTYVGIEIAVDSITLTVGGNSVTYRHFEWADGILQIANDDYSEIVQIGSIDLDNNVVEYVELYYGMYVTTDYVMYRDGAEYDLSDYVGTYVGSGALMGAKVVISEDGISVWLPGVTGENAAEGIYVGRYYDTNYDEFTLISFRIEEALIFYIEPLSKDKVLLYDDLDDWGEMILVSETYVLDYSGYYGEYVDLEDATRTLKIEEGKITVVKDGEEEEFFGFDFFDVEYGRPCFMIYNADDSACTLVQNGNVSAYLNYYYLNPDTRELEFNYFFVKKDYVPNFDNIAGNYVGTDGTDKYTLGIGDGEITLSKNGEEQTISAVMYDNVYDIGEVVYDLSFKWDGKYYHLQPLDAVDGKILQLAFDVEQTDGGSLSLVPLFIFNLDVTEEVEDMTEFVGSYEGEGFKAVVTASEMTFFADGEQATLDDFHFESYFDYDAFATAYRFRFSVDGVSYVMQPADGNACMVLTADEKAYVLIAENYELVADYEGYEGYFESAEGTLYAVEITADAITVAVDGDEQEVSVVYFGAQAGFVITFGGKTYHLNAASQNGKLCLVLSDNADINAVLAPIGKPVEDWSPYYGKYTGMAESKEYSAEIRDGKIEVVIKGGDPVEAQNIVLRYDEDSRKYVFYFTLNGEPYLIVVEEAAAVRVKSADGEISCWLDKQPDESVWKKIEGVWEGEKSGKKYRIEISDAAQKLFVDDVEQTAEFKFDSGNSYTVTWDGSDYSLVYHPDDASKGSYINFSGFSPSMEYVDVDLFRAAEETECAWAEHIGTWAYEAEGYKIVITAESFHVTYEGVDYIVEAANIRYEDGVCYWTYDDVEYMLTFENGEFADVDYATEVCVYLEKAAEEAQCAWAKYVGTWSAEDETVYTVEITAEGFHVTYGQVDDVPGADYTVAAADITVQDDGYSFHWMHDGVEYMLTFDSSSLEKDGTCELADIDYEILLGYYLSRVE